MVYKFRSSGRISGIGWRQKQKVLNSGKLKAELCSLLSKGKTWSTSSLNLLYLHTNRKRKSVRQLNKQKHPSTLKKTLNKVQESALNLCISIIFDSWSWLQSYSADQCAYLRGLVALGLLLYELSFGVNRKDSAEWHSNLLVGKNVLK